MTDTERYHGNRRHTADVFSSPLRGNVEEKNIEGIMEVVQVTVVVEDLVRQTVYRVES